MRNDPTERLTQAAEDWDNADPDVRYAVERGLARDMAQRDKTWETPNVPYASFWSALIVCLCIAGMVAVAVVLCLK